MKRKKIASCFTGPVDAVKFATIEADEQSPTSQIRLDLHSEANFARNGSSATITMIQTLFFVRVLSCLRSPSSIVHTKYTIHSNQHCRRYHFQRKKKWEGT